MIAGTPTKQMILLRTDGVDYPMLAEVYPCGLALHRAENGDWMVTHVTVGKHVATAYLKREAVACIEALAAICDWTQGERLVWQHGEAIKAALARPETYGRAIR